MMVAAISEAAAASKPSNSEEGNPKRRPPLLASEKDNDNNGVNQRRPKGRQVSSRYMSPSPSSTSTTTTTTTTTTTSSSSSSSMSSLTSRRHPSPLISRSTNSTPTSITTPFPKRSQSVDRRRPMTPAPDSRPGNVGEVLGVSAATKLLVTSTRSLSVSFQGEAFSLPISKAKAKAAPPNSRKGTPERRRTNTTPLRGKIDGDQVENSRPVADQHRWPGRTRQVNPLSRSLDCSGVDYKKKVNGSGNVVKALQHSMIDESRRISFDGRLSLDLGSLMSFKAAAQRNPDANLANLANPDTYLANESSVPFDLTLSDTDSVSSGSTSGGGVLAKERNGPRGIVVSARFWQETNSRMRRLQDPGSPLLTSPSSRTVGPPKFIQSKRFSSDSPSASPRTMSSPIRGAIRPASPNKLMMSSTSSPVRGIASPARVRNAIAGSSNSNCVCIPSILNFSVDLRRGKMGENRVVDAHLLRLLYNRHLQWRFVNAGADAAFFVQRMNAEKNLWNAWITISELRRSVTFKRTKLQLLRKKLKLTSILKGQMNYLEDWALLDREHSNYLLGATEALKASTLRLPIVGKATADIQSLKDAVGSAVDVMQAMASSICSLLSKVEETNSLVTELVNVTAKERALLGQCTDFLSTLAALQVKDCSIRTHILQLNRVSTTAT